MRKMLKKGALLSTLLFGLLSCEKDIIELNTPVESTQTTEEKPTDDKLGVSKELFLNVLYGESSTLTKKPLNDGFVSNFELDKAYYSKNEQVEVLSVPVKSWGSTKISFLSVNQNKKKNQYVLVYPDTTNDKLFYVCTIEGKIIKRVVIDEFGVGHDTYLDGSRKTGRSEFCTLEIYITCTSKEHCFMRGNADQCSYWEDSQGSPPRVFRIPAICEGFSSGGGVNLPSIGNDGGANYGGAIGGGGFGSGAISIPPTQGGGSSQGFECAPGFNCLENQRNVQFQELMARLSQQEEHFLNSKTDIKNRLSFYLPTENIQEFTLFTKKLLDLIKTTENNPDTKVTEAVLFDIFSYKSFFSNATFEQCFTMAIINEMASSLTNDPVELYLLLRHKNPKYFDVAAFSKGGESIIVGEYTLTPHYDNDQNVVFYTAGRQQGAQLKNDIEYVVKPQGLQNFINRIDLYTASANIFYLNGVPNQGQIALAAGDYVEGLTKMWGEALHSAEWWFSSITILADAVVIPFLKTSLPKNQQRLNQHFQKWQSAKNNLPAHHVRDINVLWADYGYITRKLFDNAKNIFKATDDEIAQAAERIKAHRKAQNAGTNGNYGYLEGKIGNITKNGEMVRSGQADQNIANIFDAIKVNSQQEIDGVGAWLRTTDSEYKILNRLANELNAQKGGVYPHITGELKIVSERTYCPSCQGVIQQFNKMFPNVKLILIDGAK